MDDKIISKFQFYVLCTPRGTERQRVGFGAHASASSDLRLSPSPAVPRYVDPQLMIPGTENATGNHPPQAGGSGRNEPAPPAARVPPSMGCSALAEQLPFLGPDL